MLGKGIRAERLRRGLTLAQLADVAHLSVSALSQIENEVKDPSIGSLRRIAKALDVPVFRFLSDADPPGIVVRHGQRRTLTFPQSALVYQALTPDSGGNLEMLYFRLDPGGSSGPEPFSHPSDECLLIISGVAELEVEEERYALTTGDSVYIQRGLRHLLHNSGADPLEAVFAISPPKF